MDKLSDEQILAASSGWVASTLNFFPGLGAGYLYQRRWIAYFSTAGLATSWFLLGIVLNGDTEPTKTEQLVGIFGLLAISITSMIEAKITHKKALSKVKEQFQSNTQKKRRGLFR